MELAYHKYVAVTVELLLSPLFNSSIKLESGHHHSFLGLYITSQSKAYIYKRPIKGLYINGQSKVNCLYVMWSGMGNNYKIEFQNTIKVNGSKETTKYLYFQVHLIKIHVQWQDKVCEPFGITWISA